MFGKVAAEGGLHLPVRVLHSAAGYYLGTADAEGPISRESDQYWRQPEDAAVALATGLWTQRQEP